MIGYANQEGRRYQGFKGNSSCSVCARRWPSQAGRHSCGVDCGGIDAAFPRTQDDLPLVHDARQRAKAASRPPQSTWRKPGTPPTKQRLGWQELPVTGYCPLATGYPPVRDEGVRGAQVYGSSGNSGKSKTWHSCQRQRRSVIKQGGLLLSLSAAERRLQREDHGTNKPRSGALEPVGLEELQGAPAGACSAAGRFPRASARGYKRRTSGAKKRSPSHVLPLFPEEPYTWARAPPSSRMCGLGAGAVAAACAATPDDSGCGARLSTDG